MKKNIFTLVAGILVLIGFVAFTSVEFRQESQDTVLRHVVLLDLNEQATDSVLAVMDEDLQALKENISQIREMEFGINIQSDTGYSHCLLLTFNDIDDLKEYEEHPMHLEFASTYGKYVIRKTEVDYWY